MMCLEVAPELSSFSGLSANAPHHRSQMLLFTVNFCHNEIAADCQVGFAEKTMLIINCHELSLY